VKYLLINILTFIYLLSFSQTDSLEHKFFYYGDGTISSEGAFVDNKPVGYWKTYYPSGILKSEGNRLNNALDGKWIFYAENKDTLEIINYRNSTKNGWNIKFDSNNVLTKELFLDAKIIGLSYEYKKDSYLEIPHKNNLKHGLAFRYKGSSIIGIIEFKNGFKVSTKKINRYKKDTLKTGPWITFFPNRRIHTESFYKNDTLNGFYREYDMQGNLLKNLFYENGIVKTSEAETTKSKFKQEFYDNGNVKTEGYYSFGKPVGMHKEFSNSGKVLQGVLYDKDGNFIGRGQLDENGKRTGKWEFFNKKKEIISEGYYKKGRRDKEWNFYFEAGKTEQKGHYKSGKLQGEWIQYYKDGTVFKKENYKKGKLNGKFVQNKPSGELFIEGWYNDNLLNKEWVYHYEYLNIYQNYSNGERIGKWHSEYLNGKSAFKGSYEHNEPHGKHIYYYQNGVIKEYQYYIYGSKEKIWTTYDAFEDQTATYLYKNDELVKINGYKYKFSDK